MQDWADDDEGVKPVNPRVQRAEIRFDGMAGCLRTPAGGSSKQLLIVTENGRARLRPMMAREAARLMGLEDAYQLPAGETAALKVIGDGVSVPVVRWLGLHLLVPLAGAMGQRPLHSQHSARKRSVLDCTLPVPQGQFMGTRERQIDRAIARAQRGEFFRMLWESKVLLGSSVFLLAVIGFGASFTSTPPRLQASVLGHALNEVNVMVTRKGQEVRREIVELDTGARVQLDIPAIGPIRHNAEIRVEIYAKGWGPFHQVTYRFAGYPAAPGQS